MLPAGDSQLLQIVDAALADAAQRAGEWLACRPGCNQCCTGAFAIDALDAARLRAHMLRLEKDDPERAQILRQSARSWVAAHAADFPGDPVSGVLGSTEADRERFEDFANDAACPALDAATGRCAVYAARPMTCRVFGPPVRNEGGALGLCELCFQGAPTDVVLACEMKVPNELEERLLAELGDRRETLVAYALASAPGLFPPIGEEP